MAPDAQIQKAIARATKYAMSPKDMARLVSLFPEAQRENISKSSTFSHGYGDKLDKRIESISKAWKEKYGNDFAISNAHSFVSPTFASIHLEAHRPQQSQPGISPCSDQGCRRGGKTSGAVRVREEQRLENRRSGFTDRR